MSAWYEKPLHWNVDETNEECKAAWQPLLNGAGTFKSPQEAKRNCNHTVPD